MGFYEVDVIVEGALDSSETFPDTQRGRLAKATFIGNIDRESRSEGFRAEVYELFHDHAEFDEDDDEDTCNQYVTDGHPTYTFPSKDGDA